MAQPVVSESDEDSTTMESEERNYWIREEALSPDLTTLVYSEDNTPGGLQVGSPWFTNHDHSGGSTFGDILRMKISPSGDFLLVYSTNQGGRCILGIWINGSEENQYYCGSDTHPHNWGMGTVDFAPDESVFATCGSSGNNYNKIGILPISNYHLIDVNEDGIPDSHDAYESTILSTSFLDPNGNDNPVICTQLAFNPVNSNLVVVWREYINCVACDETNITMTVTEYAHENGSYTGVEPIVLDQFQDSLYNYWEEREIKFSEDGELLAITNLPMGSAYIRNMVTNESEFIDLVQYCNGYDNFCTWDVSISPDINWLAISTNNLPDNNYSCQMVLHSLEDNLSYQFPIGTTSADSSQVSWNCHLAARFNQDSTKIELWGSSELSSKWMDGWCDEDDPSIPGCQNHSVNPLIMMNSVELPTDPNHWISINSSIPPPEEIRQPLRYVAPIDYSALYTLENSTIYKWRNPNGGTDDAFPNNPDEWLDTDNDGIGNNADLDDDGDGTPDNEDLYPLDFDNDGWDDIFEIECGTNPYSSSSIPNDNDDDSVLPSYVAGSINLCDVVDHDDDNDGYLDINDDFPLDSSEWLDSDGDLIGDNADFFPFDNLEWLDTDYDGIGNNADTDDDGDGFSDLEESECGSNSLNLWDQPNDYDFDGHCDLQDLDDDNDGYEDLIEISCLSNQFDLSSTPIDSDFDGSCDALDIDIDGDGYENLYDLFPEDPNEWADFDNDDMGDNADLDDDNDGYLDINDVFPLDSSEWLDLDLDGIGDNADLDDDGDLWTDVVELACGSPPYDGTQRPGDHDGDGSCDILDTDDDGDGWPDSLDAFPYSIFEWADNDQDGIGDNSDIDDDNDGYLDINDAFSYDATEWLDSDADGYGDNVDAFPNDATEWLDADADGYGDNVDEFPNDATKWLEITVDESSDSSFIYGGNIKFLLILILPALLVIISSNFNSFVIESTNRIPGIKNSGEKIRRLHYSEWSIERKELLQSSFDNSVTIGGGLIGYLLVALGYVVAYSLMGALYLMYIGLYALGAVIAAYLIVAGIILLFTAGAVGLICFLPFLILLPFVG